MGICYFSFFFVELLIVVNWVLLFFFFFFFECYVFDYLVLLTFSGL